MTSIIGLVLFLEEVQVVEVANLMLWKGEISRLRQMGTMTQEGKVTESTHVMN